MKLFVYRAYGDLVGLQLCKEPIADKDLQGSIRTNHSGEDEGEYCWTLIGTMEVSSLEGEKLVQDLERHGRVSVWATFGTFWNH